MQSSAENDERVMSLVAEALGLAPEKRMGFLRAACGAEPDLYSQAADVLDWEERMGSFLCQPLIENIDLEQVESAPQVFQSRDLLCEGRFEIVRQVGEGGMAQVYEVIDRKRNKRIAIKCAKPGFGKLLAPELEGALNIRHPNICLVNDTHTAKTDSGEIDFLTMEFLDGETLAQRLHREGKLAPEQALIIGRQLCAGLSAAHRAGILHRDLKPSNIILSRNEPGSIRAVITDFGLACESHLQSEIEGGTPRYMAPELWEGKKPGKASDVYALGVILYEMITGTKSFQPSQLWDGRPTADPEPPSTLGQGLPALWDKAILPCLDRAPHRRPDADEILAVFDRKPLWKSPALAAAVLAVIALLAAFQQPLLKLFKPAEIRIAVLPVEATGDLAKLGGGMLQDVSARVRRLHKGKSTIVVIPASDLASSNVRTPEQARKVLNATHVLQLTLARSDSGVSARAVIVDLSTLSPVKNFSARYTDFNLGDMPGALAGAVSSALHLNLPFQDDYLSPQATAAYDRGLSQLEPGERNYSDAIAFFQEAANQDPHSPLPLAGMAEAYFRQFQSTNDPKWLDEAGNALANAERVNPDSVAVHRAAGLIEMGTGKDAKALQEYQRILEIDPHDLEAILLCAEIYDVQHMPEQAVQMYRHAIAIAPEYFEPYELFGRFYLIRGEYGEAEEQFRQAVQKAPGRAHDYANLGGALLGECKCQDAVNMLQASLRIQPNPQILNNLGIAQAYLGEDAQAIDAFQSAVSSRPTNDLYLLNLGDSQRRLGKAAESQRSYQQAIKLIWPQLAANPERAQVRARLAYLEARTGDPAAAEHEVQQALQFAPSDADVMAWAVRTFEIVNERESAFRVLAGAPAAVLNLIACHPDLADFRKDSRFIRLREAKKEEIAHVR